MHQWNTLTIYRYRWDAWIELNEKRRTRGRSSGIFSRITFRNYFIVHGDLYFELLSILGTPIYLGSRGNSTSENLSKGFSGCIRKFVVNGHEYELSKLSSKEIMSLSNLSEYTLHVMRYFDILIHWYFQMSVLSINVASSNVFTEEGVKVVLLLAFALWDSEENSAIRSLIWMWDYRRYIYIIFDVFFLLHIDTYV